MFYCRVFPDPNRQIVCNGVTYKERLEAETLEELADRLHAVIQFERHYLEADWEDFLIPFVIEDEYGNKVAQWFKEDAGYISLADLKRMRANANDHDTGGSS